MKGWPLTRRSEGSSSELASIQLQLGKNGLLRFADISPRPQLPITIDAPPKDASREREELLTRRFLHVAWVSQSIVLFILITLAATLFVLGSRAAETVNSHYNELLPVIYEMTNHSLGIMRRAHSSASAVDRMALHTEEASQVSIPALIESVNRTAAAVAAVTHMAAHPVLKVSMEP